jgi:MFS superfamily sulfate permease-like transporter
MTEGDYMFYACLDSIEYAIRKLKDKSTENIDMYLDEAKYNIDTAIQAREEIKKELKNEHSCKETNGKHI